MRAGDELAHDFFASLGGAPFGHRDHLQLAWLAVRESPRPEELVRGAIQRYAAAHGAAAKYHETVTLFWVQLVRHCVAARRDIDDFEAFLAAFPLLLDKRMLTRHWNAETLFTDEARSAWVDPDLLPLPA
jgi:hypothetical protein